MMSHGPGDHDTSGSIRAAGGSFAKMEVAHEEEYFYKLVSWILFCGHWIFCFLPYLYWDVTYSLNIINS